MTWDNLWARVFKSTTERKGIDMSIDNENISRVIETGIEDIAQTGVSLGKVTVANIAMGHLVDIMALTNESLVREAIQKAAHELAAIVNEIEEEQH